MPAQKRSNEALYEEDDDDIVELQRVESSFEGHEEEDGEEDDGEEPEQESEEESLSSSSSEKAEFVLVKLAEVRKEVQCPICLGIIRKTRTVMECLHRFCRECIDKSMRLGNNECPACRAHCASRRSLRDDPNYDALIAVLYPDIDKYEAEELAFHEEERARNKQIQASIAQTSRRQLEALGKKRTNAKATAAAFIRRSQGNGRNLRGRRRRRSTEPQESDNEDDADNNDGGKDSLSSEEPAEARSKRLKRGGGSSSSHPSIPSSSADGGGDGNEAEGNRETVGVSGSSEILAWGRGGMRSHTRHGSLLATAGKSARSNRLSKLIDHLRNLPKDSEMAIHLRFISINEKHMPMMQHPYLCCSPTVSIRNLCQYVATKTGTQDGEIELLLVKGDHFELSPAAELPEAILANSSTDKLQPLEEHQTISDVTRLSMEITLTLAYRKKTSS